MDKTAIKNFAIEARKILMKSAVSEAGFYGITKDECKSPVQKGKDFEVYETLAGTENRIYGDDIKRRANLVKAIKEQGFDQVIEETAYTWFNRIIAIRFMEVNNYLPTRVRVLSSETGSGTPDIITQADTVDLNLTAEELDRIQSAKRENKYDEAFRLLFVKQCNELNAILPGLFEKTDDYMELLLKITYTSDGVVRMLVDTIQEDNFNVETEGQVEIIGWMYQYYNTELKDDTFAKLKKNVKITKERIPAATQLFTPDWIVRYMVENSLGRVWIEHLRAVDPSTDEKAKSEEFGWKYYLPEAEQEDDVAAQLVEIRQSYKDLTPQDITCIDPCMGSGHILVYMFDVLMDIYRSEGFSEREAVFDILEKNIRGLDIDRRAYQLSYFALMMKARSYNRIFFRGKEDMDGKRTQAVPQVYAIEESNNINTKQLKYFGENLLEDEKNKAMKQIQMLIEQFADAKEYGSVLKIDDYDWKLLANYLSEYNLRGQIELDMVGIEDTQRNCLKMVQIGKILSSKCDAVVTNPPYMNSFSMNDKLNKYVKKYYSNSKSDLFSVVMEKCLSIVKNEGYLGMITMHSWMFLLSFVDLRSDIVNNFSIYSLLHLGIKAFEETGNDVVQTAAFVIAGGKRKDYIGKYYRLLNHDRSEKQREYLARENESVISQDKFLLIPDSPIAYWLTNNFLSIFGYKKVGDYGTAKQGLITGDNNNFLRLWYEPNIETIGFDMASRDAASESMKKWFPYNKGGDYKKWYGNNNYVVLWENDGYEIQHFVDSKGKLRSRPQNMQYYFKKGITWSSITTGSFSCRCYDEGFLFDSGANGLFIDNPDYYYYLEGFLNSKIAAQVLKIINPTINNGPGSVEKIPVIVDKENLERVNALVKENISLVKSDWDSRETSWNFEEHPLVKYAKNIELTETSISTSECSLEYYYSLWEKECNDRFNKLKKNEEELNKIFIGIYGLNDEMDFTIDDKDISVQLADVGNSIKSLISYAVGCIMGRYSTIEKGLICAGGIFNPERYNSDIVCNDAIVTVSDEEYFPDDIVNRVENFIKIIFGEKYFRNNMKYLTDVLSSKKITPSEKLREYFLNEFYKDHCSMYSVTGSGKRPIYWLFDAGKQNGFKCLIYIHRYSKETVGKIRSDYLIKVQSAIENALKNVEYTIQSSESSVDKANATKLRDKYIKQLSEMKTYYQALSHVALQNLEISLDDGIKMNYSKFQGIEVSNEGEKKQTIDLLAKI